MERRKGFMEDGGGFVRIWNGFLRAIKCFRHHWTAKLLGFLALLLAMAWLVNSYAWQELFYGVHNWNLLDRLQAEAGLPESVVISEEELFCINYDVVGIPRWGIQIRQDHVEDLFAEKFGYNPISDQELQLINESAEYFSMLWDAELSIHPRNHRSLFVLACGIGCWLMGRKKGGYAMQRTAVWLGFLIGALPVAIFALWGKIDFSGMLHAVCGWLFTGDIWLLNPEESLLAQIYPQSVLRGIGRHVVWKYAIDLAVIAACLVALDLAVFGFGKLYKYLKVKNGKKRNHNENPEI